MSEFHSASSSTERVRLRARVYSLSAVGLGVAGVVGFFSTVGSTAAHAVTKPIAHAKAAAHAKGAAHSVKHPSGTSPTTRPSASPVTAKAPVRSYTPRPVTPPPAAPVTHAPPAPAPKPPAPAPKAPAPTPAYTPLPTPTHSS